MRALRYTTGVATAAAGMAPGLLAAASLRGAAVPEGQEDVNRQRSRATAAAASRLRPAQQAALTAGQDRVGVNQDRGDATSFRCGGCGAAALFVQRERRYGRLARDFFDQHERCGGAMEISAARPPQARARARSGI